jgi:hypothetical protein
MPPTTRREPLPGASFTGDELFCLARDFLGFSWTFTDRGIAVLHHGTEVTIVESAQEARRAMCDFAVGMIRAGAEPIDEVDIEHT